MEKKFTPEEYYRECNTCGSDVKISSYYSAFLNKNMHQVTCANNHSYTFSDDVLTRTVCPYCEHEAVKACNCIETTYSCKNEHSWLRCKKYNHLTKSRFPAHFVGCDKCLSM